MKTTEQKMYKVTIYYGDDNDYFKTEMPKIPLKNDKIGFFNLNNDWMVEDVDYILYNFDRKGRWIETEINCKVK